MIRMFRLTLIKLIAVSALAVSSDLEYYKNDNSELYRSKFNKLRHITLRDDAFCEAYQEYKDGNCIAKLTFCSPLTDYQLLKMRQILCGLKFNRDVQPDAHIQKAPEIADVANINQTEPDPFLIPEYPPPYFLDIHPSQPNSFPWLAAIYNKQRQFLCSGALVAPKTVITSAQCVWQDEQEQNNDNGANFLVRFGRHNLNVSSVYDKAYEYDVESIEISQQFDRNTLENDFAILKLVSPVCNIAPILLPKRDDWENGHYFGNRAPVLYAGWGLGHYQKPYLRSLSSHLITRDKCCSKFNWSPDQLSNSHLCVSAPINVCVGGIGTPLIASAQHHHSVLLGILSLGDHCNTPKLPLIFTKVSSFIDEIERFIEDDFKSMNETSPLEDCVRSKHYYTKQLPFYFYPPHYYHKQHVLDQKYHFPKSHSQY